MITLKSDKLSYGINLPTSVDEITKESESRKREFAETKKQFDIYRAKMEALLISQLELLKDMKED